MDDMREFEVTLTFEGGGTRAVRFLAQEMADALPQAVEIAEANLNLGDAIKIEVDRLALAGG